MISVKKTLIDVGYDRLDSANSVEFLTMHGMFVVPSTRQGKEIMIEFNRIDRREAS